MSKKTIIDDTGLNQFDRNPTDSPDLMEMIADTWIEKALYYGLKKCGDFSWRESWVIVDGTKYNISINNTEIMGDRDCAGLEIELRKLREKIDKAIEELQKEIEENHLNVIEYADGEWIVKDFVYGAIERFKRSIGE